MTQINQNQRIILVIDTSGLAKKTDYNSKITEIESKIPDITNLVTKTTLTAMTYLT